MKLDTNVFRERLRFASSVYAKTILLGLILTKLEDLLIMKAGDIFKSDYLIYIFYFL